VDGSTNNLANYTYAYDNAGRVTSETRNSLTVAYTYDAVNQLLTDGTNNLTYDPTGNCTNGSNSTGTGNQLTTDGTNNFTYDAEGNLIKKVVISTGVTWVYTYDNRNEMTQAQKWSADPNSGGTLQLEADYKYDVFGGRIQSTVVGGATTRYALDYWTQAGLDLSAASSVLWADLDGSSNLETRYVGGDALDQVFARIDSGTSLYWLLTDGEGSVRNVLTSVGSIQDTISYDGFGSILSETNPTYGGRLKYTGRELDSETGLQYTRWRYYDTTTGRWTTEDPLGLRVDVNAYRYVINQPTNAIDPSGLTPEGEDNGWWPSLPSLDPVQGFQNAVSTASNLADDLGSRANVVAGAATQFGNDALATGGNALRTGANAVVTAPGNIVSGGQALVQNGVEAVAEAHPELANLANDARQQLAATANNVQQSAADWSNQALGTLRVIDGLRQPQPGEAAGTTVLDRAEQLILDSPAVPQLAQRVVQTGSNVRTFVRQWRDVPVIAAAATSLETAEGVGDFFLQANSNALRIIDGEYGAALQGQVVFTGSTISHLTESATPWMQLTGVGEWVDNRLAALDPAAARGGQGYAVAVRHIIEAAMAIGAAGEAPAAARPTVNTRLPARVTQELPAGQARRPAEAAQARNFFKRNRAAAEQWWEQRTGQQWPANATHAEHPRPLANGGDPLFIEPGFGGPNAPHMVPGPDGLTDFQRWGMRGGRPPNQN
jgi:RHS repeat-associated protein